MGQDGKMYKVSKPFYKKVWFWVLIVLLFFGIGGALSGGENKDSATATSTSTNKETTKESSDISSIEISTNTKETKQSAIDSKSITSSSESSWNFFKSVISIKWYGPK